MADDIRIEDIRSLDEAAPLAPLFEAMYAHFAVVAGRPLLREGGFGPWLIGYPAAALKSRLICAAWRGGQPIGFAEGSVRLPPAYFAPRLCGFVGHLYVVPEERGGGLAAALARRLDAWFDERGVKEIQLHVLDGNAAALRFWSKRGFRAELLQMRSDRG